MEWFPFYIDDFERDTAHLTVAQEGVYHRLLRWYYKNESPLSNDDQALARIAGVALSEWEAMSPRIRAFFVTRDKRDGNGPVLLHKRCNEVIAAQNKKRRDGKSRQEKLRKNGVLEAVTRDKRESNAPRVRVESEVDETLSPPAQTESTTTSGVPGEGGAGGSAKADAPAARQPDPPVTGGAPPKPKAPRKPKTARTRLPETWEPNQAMRSYADVAGLEDHQIDAIAVRFHRYWRSGDAKGGGLKADWDATWANWIDREIADGALGRGNGRSGPNGHRQEPDSGVARFLRRNLGPDSPPDVPIHGRGPPGVSGMAPHGPRPKPGPIAGFGDRPTDLDWDAQSGTFKTPGRPPRDDRDPR